MGVRAAQYLRVSSTGQAHSLSNQSALIAAYAGAVGFEIVRTFVDEGRSGLRLKGRAALQALLAEVLAEPREFEAILVQDVSRWGRFQDTDEASHYEFLCRSAGVPIHYCAETFEEGRPTAGLMKTVKRIMAAEFSRELSHKTRSAQFKWAAAGYKMGGVAGYGLRRAILDADGQIKAVLEPGEQRLLRGDRVILTPGPPREVAVVRRIYRLFLDVGLRQGEIAQQLNAEGEPGEAGRAWNTWTIGQVLSNPKYAGVYRFGRSRRGLDGRRRYPDPAQHQLTCEAFEPIVPLARIAAANAKRDRRMLFLSRDEMLVRLKVLAAQEGGVTIASIAATPTLPSPHTVTRHLGSLWALNARVGCYPTRAARNVPLTILPGRIDGLGATRHGANPGKRKTSMTANLVASCTAFIGDKMIAAGAPTDVALALKAAGADVSGPMPLVFNDATGEVLELDLRGSERDIVARLQPKAEEPPRPARGRPKMGVTAREVTLMPKHWEWLSKQQGGASAALRRLVEAASKSSATEDAKRTLQDRAYKVIYALAGHLPGYEEVVRSLFADDAKRLVALCSEWPSDIRTYVLKLTAAAAE